ncbi:hypothetical protein [Phaffia rhodozyma]|uniref:Uncharacterized protein n=1 Tax=Phaffia rhodozyma TaxID=264483 RepID=A0A0F7SQD1_PHARH|nr:hypothetical protein [Phaffia rhodozyma]
MPSSRSSDSDAFDLSLVADSMSYMNDRSNNSSNGSNGNSNSKGVDSNPPAASSLANIDLSSLTPEDLALLQPMIDLLNQTATLDSEEDQGENAAGELAKKLDEADQVADGLEGMLDRLLDKLGGMIDEEGEEGVEAGEEGEIEKEENEKGEQGQQE